MNSFPITADESRAAAADLQEVVAGARESTPMSVEHYTEVNGDEIADLLVGRRIVTAEMGSFDYLGRSSRDNLAEGRLVLDDGTTLYLAGHEGVCDCGAGDYPLATVATVDNIITSARVAASPSGDGQIGDGTYRIFVVADAVEINVAEFVGTDGNGYYGTGFVLTVVAPSAR